MHTKTKDNKSHRPRAVLSVHQFLLLPFQRDIIDLETFEACLGLIRLMQWGKRCISHRCPDLVFSAPAPDSDPRPLEGCTGSIGPRTAHPGGAELRRRAAAVYRTFQKKYLRLSASVLHARAVMQGLVCLFACVCAKV